MKPIETLYKGVKFRSRLEARHAVMFDALNIKWEYEIEGFQLPNGKWYLPDFFLPDVYLRNVDNSGVFFEVKPSMQEAEKSTEIFSNFDKPLVVSCGTPNLEFWADTEWLFEWWKEGWDNCMYFKFCKKCGTYEIEFSEGSYINCRNRCGGRTGINNWKQIATEMKSYRF